VEGVWELGRRGDVDGNSMGKDEAEADTLMKLQSKNKVAVVETSKATGVGPAEPQPSNVSHLEHHQNTLTLHYDLLDVSPREISMLSWEI
jgi:hypothetical protein